MNDLVQEQNFESILLSIRSAQKDVYTYANASLIKLYYQIGSYVSEKVENSNWGKGVVEEYRLSVGNDDFYIDLLFFHRKLECLVAFELKTDKFKPSYMGQLEFY